MEVKEDLEKLYAHFTINHDFTMRDIMLTIKFEKPIDPMDWVIAVLTLLSDIKDDADAEKLFDDYVEESHNCQ